MVSLTQTIAQIVLVYLSYEQPEPVNERDQNDPEGTSTDPPHHQQQISRLEQPKVAVWDLNPHLQQKRLDICPPLLTSALQPQTHLSRHLLSKAQIPVPVPRL